MCYIVKVRMEKIADEKETVVRSMQIIFWKNGCHWQWNIIYIKFHNNQSLFIFK